MGRYGRLSDTDSDHYERLRSRYLLSQEGIGPRMDKEELAIYQELRRQVLEAEAQYRRLMGWDPVEPTE